MSLVVTILGCGTSTGVPVIGCHCAVCTSDDPRNRRLRCGLRVEGGGRTVLVDTPPDLRQQALAHCIEEVDAVVFTHAHADHIFGLDDLRTFCFRRERPIPCYGSAATLRRIRETFAYVFDGGGQEGGGKPRLELRPIAGDFAVEGMPWRAIPLLHGRLEVYGYRIGDFAYLTDCSAIPDASRELLAGVDTLVLDALRYRPHSTHFHLAAAVEEARRIGARRTYFTHLAHDIDATAVEIELPPGMELAHDGLRLEL